MNISITKLKAYKACPRMYQLHYVEGLTPVDTAEPLRSGASYHALIDAFNNGDMMIEEPTKEWAMFRAYCKYIAPNFTVHKSEEWLQMPICNGKHTLVGIADGIAEDGNIVEHKTTSGNITEQYEYDLQWDEQILAYMLMTGSRKVWYTVVKKPTIRQMQKESDEAFYERMIKWYDEDTESKIRLFAIERTDEEVEDFRKELEAMCEEIDSQNHFYRNTCHCNHWGRRCEYSSVCLHYDPNQEYIEFQKS